jgi:cholinesterase
MRRVFLLLVVVALCGGNLQGQAPVDRMYVFGDSYSDIGRGWVDSDGPTAVAYLAKRLGLAMVASNAPETKGKSLDFAVSGAPSGRNPGHEVPKGWLGLGMKNQVAEFTGMVRDGKVRFEPKTTMFFVAGGLNDRRISTEETIANIEAELIVLYEAGGRRFRVAVLPEKIPAFGDVGRRLNPALKEIPAQMRPKLAGAEIETSEWGAYFDEVMDHPAKYGITDTTSKCAGREIFNEDATPCASPQTHYYYHAGHPSTVVHKAVGDMLYEEMMKH